MSGDQLPDKFNFLGAVVAPAITKCALHNCQLKQSENGTQALCELFLAPVLGANLSGRRNRPPQRSRLGAAGIAIPQEQLELMHIQAQGGLLADTGPPAKSALRKALLTEPVALTVIAQNLQGPSPPIREDEQSAGDWVGIEPLAANSHQPVDAFAEIHGLDRQ